MSVPGARIGLVGPLPPPSGGMANQTLQLSNLLREEGSRWISSRSTGLTARLGRSAKGGEGSVSAAALSCSSCGRPLGGFSCFM